MDISNNELAQSKSILTEYYNESDALLMETQKFVSKIQDQDSNSTKTKELILSNIKNQEIISCLTNTALLICKLSMGESVDGIFWLVVCLTIFMFRYKNYRSNFKST